MKKHNRKKVFVAILNQGNISAGMESQLLNWMREKGDKYIFTAFPSRYSFRPISNNRNRIVKDFLKSDCDYLFMIDDDNPPVPQNNIFDLLDFDKDVIGAVVPGHNLQGIHFHAYNFGEVREDGSQVFLQLPNSQRSGLQKIGAIGTCCIAIKRKVLEKIKKPFEDLYDEDGILLNNDDMAFCIKCRDNKFEVWCHWLYMCSHYKKVDLLQMAHLLMRPKTPKIHKLTGQEAQQFLNDKP